MEVKPSEKSVAHHLCVRFLEHSPDVKYGVPSGTQSSARLLGDGNEDCYLPGHSATDYRPYSAAKLISAGTDVEFRLHDTANGKDIVDRPQLGFTVRKDPPRRRWVSALIAPDREKFKIPPYDPNWEAPHFEATFTEDVELVQFMPHMHFRGKDMMFRLEYPNGRSDIALSVPKYDFNWQIGYQLAEPLKVPKGTKISAIAHYNNSPSNRYNPDPSATVPWGEQSWDEMMSPFFAYLADVKVDSRKILQRPRSTTAVAESR